MNITTHANLPVPTGNDAAGGTPLNRAVASAHETVDRVAGAADSAARKVGPAIDHAADFAHQTVDKVADAAAPTAAWLSEQGDRLKQRQRTAADDAGQYVAAHPWKSVGIAFAAGYLISRFMR